MEMYDQLVSVLSPIVKIYHRLEAHGLENVPDADRRVIITPNHPHWFGWDAVIISCVLKGRRVRWLSWSYDEHPMWDMGVRMFNGILHNNSRPFPYREIIEEDINGGSDVGIFPEGTNNPVSKWGRVGVFFPGAVRLAAMSGVPLLPVSIHGLEQASPILWIKEEERQPPKHLLAPPVIFPSKVIVRFGEPYNPESLTIDADDREALYREARILQLKVLRLLKNDNPKAYTEPPEDGKPVNARVRGGA